MEPALTQFESKYKKKFNLVTINVDEKEKPETKRYHKLSKLSESIPFTVWLDSKGNVLDKYAGSLTEKQLASRSDEAALKAR